MRSGFLMRCGSATYNPETSVQFSYDVMSKDKATILPVKSEPPRLKTRIFRSGVDA